MTRAQPPTDDELAALAVVAYRVAFRLTGVRADAEDVAQEAVARAVVRWGSVAGYAEAWVARVASNLALGLLRRRARRPIESPSHAPDPFLDDRLDLASALRRLPRRQREVVVLRYLADLSERQVADRLGCSTGAVKTHASRGLASLRVHLDVATLGGPE